MKPEQPQVLPVRPLSISGPRSPMCYYAAPPPLGCIHSWARPSTDNIDQSVDRNWSLCRVEKKEALPSTVVLPYAGDVARMIVRQSCNSYNRQSCNSHIRQRPTFPAACSCNCAGPWNSISARDGTPGALDMPRSNTELTKLDPHSVHKRWPRAQRKCEGAGRKKTQSGQTPSNLLVVRFHGLNKAIQIPVSS